LARVGAPSPRFPDCLASVPSGIDAVSQTPFRTGSPADPALTGNNGQGPGKK